jgi:hypothetical protein
MPKAILVLGTNPVSAEREDEYNDWYTNTHIGDVMKLDGVTSARRFVLSPVRPAPGAAPSPFRYLAIYEVEADDLQRLAVDLREAQASGQMYVSDALGSPVSTDFYVPIDGAHLP